MVDLILIAVLVIIIGLSALYVYKAKKSGKTCIGCPNGCSCNTKNSTSPCCCNNRETDKQNA